MNLNCGEIRITKNLYILLPYVSHPKSIEVKEGIWRETFYRCKCRLGTYFKFIDDKTGLLITFRILGFGILYVEYY